MGIEIAQELRTMAVESVAGSDGARATQLAHSLWRDALGGRARIVDRFQIDGRSYIVARRQEASDAVVSETLSRREADVAIVAASGVALKTIGAEELGHEIETVVEDRLPLRRDAFTRRRSVEHSENTIDELPHRVPHHLRFERGLRGEASGQDNLSELERRAHRSSGERLPVFAVEAAPAQVRALNVR